MERKNALLLRDALWRTLYLGSDRRHDPQSLRPDVCSPMSLPSLAGAAWLGDPSLQRVLAALAGTGGEARIAGGAVRNALLGEAVGDIDIATTLSPAEVMK